MDTDLSMALIAARTAATQQSAALAIVKKSHEMDMALVQMVDETARAAAAPPPPGQGRVVDKTA
jgi:hypothetical protein